MAMMKQLDTAKHASATPSQYRMVALDLDGTLLNKEHQLTEASAEMLRSLSSSGFTVALATGRSAPAVYEHVKKLRLPKPLPVVCYNGASCRIFPAATTNPREEQSTLFEEPLDDATVDAVLEFAARWVLSPPTTNHDPTHRPTTPPVLV